MQKFAKRNREIALNVLILKFGERNGENLSGNLGLKYGTKRNLFKTNTNA